jgi:hypothetical protein
MRRQLMAAALVAVGCCGAAQAATMAFPVGGYAYSDAPANASGNAVQVTVTTVKAAGNAEDAMNLASLTLQPGTYTYSMDVRLDKAISYLKIEGASEKSGSNNVWDQRPTLGPVGVWRRITATVTVASDANGAAWQGHLQLKAGMWGGTNDAGGSGSLLVDNITLTDSNATSLFAYNFDSNTVGVTPAGLTVYGNCNSNGLGSAQPPTGTLLVAAVPEPMTMAAVAGVLGLGALRRRRA